MSIDLSMNMINGCPLLETNLLRENKIDSSRNSGFGGYKVLTRFTHSLLFPSSTIKKEALLPGQGLVYSIFESKVVMSQMSQ